MFAHSGRMATGVDLYLGANSDVAANGGLLGLSTWLHDLGKSIPSIRDATRSAINFRKGGDKALGDELMAIIKPHDEIGAGIAEANGSAPRLARSSEDTIRRHRRPRARSSKRSTGSMP